MNLYIGSGDIKNILMGVNTKGYQDFMRKFVSDEKPNYNAFASPIDALRTGAILEQRYLQVLDNSYFCQWRSIFTEMDVFISSIDFAKFENGFIIDFDELKTIYLTDYLELIQPLKNKSETEYTSFLKKHFKSNYEQLQAQLMCTGLDYANLVFLSVETYDDEINSQRNILENDFIKFKIKKDDFVIEKIKERGKIFQLIKDNFNVKDNTN